VNNPSFEPNFYAVIPAGGVGSRLWPLSRVASPKFLQDFTDSGRSLLQETFARLAAFLPAERILVVTGAAHADEVARQLPQLPEANLLIEPSPRESTAAIALATSVALQRDADAIVGSFAADHVIIDQAGFESVVSVAAEQAQLGHIVAIGIEPTSATSAYGYIKCGETLSESVCRVQSFVEKPSQAVAAEYLASGAYLWNAGMFIARAERLIGAIELTEPELVRAVEKLAAALSAGQHQAADTELWSSIKKVAIDYSVAEPAAARGEMRVVRASFDWTDVGDFASLSDLGDQTFDQVRTLGDVRVVSLDSTGLVVGSGGKVVVISGLDDVVVVDTPDALLITTREKAQTTKDAVANLREMGHDDVL
jgi:mannose-1-phosphate guanylyltransferase